MDDGKTTAPDLASLLSVNQLDYRLPPSLSVANSRSMKQFRSSRLQHEFGGLIEIVLSTCASYCDLRNSFLSFDVVVPPGVNRTSLGLPSGAGWQQLLSAYTIVHSSGVELDRMKESLGEWTQIQNYYEFDKTYRENVCGPLWGHREIDTTKRRQYTLPAAGITINDISNLTY